MAEEGLKVRRARNSYAWVVVDASTNRIVERHEYLDDLAYAWDVLQSWEDPDD